MNKITNKLVLKSLMFEHAATSILEVHMLDDSLLLLLIVQKDFYVKKNRKTFHSRKSVLAKNNLAIRKNLYL